MSAIDGGSSPQQGAGFSRRTVVWIVVATAVSFIVALLLMAFGPDLTETPTAGPSTFSRSALGHHALLRFLEESGLPVQLRRSRRVFHGGPRTPVLVAEPNPDLLRVDLAGELSSLLRRASRRSAPLVLVLPKWRGEPYRSEQGFWVENVSLLSAELVNTVLEGVANVSVESLRLRRSSDFTDRRERFHTAWGEELRLTLIAPQLLVPTKACQPLVWSTEGVLLARVGDPATAHPLYIISDPDVLNNHGLGRDDNALVPHRLLLDRLDARSMVIDETIHGHARELSFLAETLRFPMVLIVLHVVFVFLVVLWAGMGRFGKPQPDAPRLPRGTLGLIDNTSHLLSYRGRVLDSAERYFEETLLGVARHHYMPRELGKDAILDRLQKISDDRGMQVDLGGLRNRLRRLRASTTHVDSGSVRIALELHDWRREMTDGH